MQYIDKYITLAVYLNRRQESIEVGLQDRPLTSPGYVVLIINIFNLWTNKTTIFYNQFQFANDSHYIKHCLDKIQCGIHYFKVTRALFCLFQNSSKLIKRSLFILLQFFNGSWNLTLNERYGYVFAMSTFSSYEIVSLSVRFVVLIVN